MAFKKEKKTTKEVTEEKLDTLSLRRKPILDLTEKLDDTLPPIRISKSVKHFLEDHFKSKGTQLSNGIRMIVYDYVKKNM